MVVGVLEIDLFIGHAQSLKEKRAVVRKMTDRIGNKFNVSVAEVGYMDIHQRSTIAVAAVSNDQKFTNGVLNKVHMFAERLMLAEITDVRMGFY